MSETQILFVGMVAVFAPIIYGVVKVNLWNYRRRKAMNPVDRLIEDNETRDDLFVW